MIKQKADRTPKSSLPQPQASTITRSASLIEQNDAETEQTTRPDFPVSSGLDSNHLHTAQRQQLMTNIGKQYGNQKVLRMLEVYKTPASNHPLTTNNPKVIQRSIYKKKNELFDPEIIRESTAYQKLSELRKSIVEFWITSPTVHKECSSINQIMEAVKKEIANLSEVTIKNMSRIQLYDLETDDSIQNDTKKLELVRQRLKELAQENVSLWQNSSLHDPTSFQPEGVSLPEKSITTVSSQKGRDDGKFFTVKNSLPGASTNTTNAPNRDLSTELITDGNYQEIGSQNMQICPTCQKLLPVEFFEVDHQEAFSDIREKLHSLASAMQIDSKLQTKIKDELGESLFEDYFITNTSKVHWQQLYPTVAAMKQYSNDLSNLFRICRLCNGAGGKSNMAYLEWYGKSSLYGKTFITENVPDDVNKFILGRTKSGEGWGEAARKWFNTHHWPVLQKLFKIAQPTEQLNQSVRKENEINYKLAFLPHPPKQGEKETLTSQSNQLNLVNQSSISTFSVLGNWTEQPHYPMAPSSPSRMELEFTNQLEKREEVRKERHFSNFSPYEEGQIDGRLNQPKKTIYVNQEAEAYNYGYSMGMEYHSSDQKQGYMNGVKDPESPDKELQYSEFYMKGFQKGTQQRKETQEKGFSDGYNQAHPLPKYDREDPAVLELIDLYLKSYGHGQDDQKFFTRLQSLLIKGEINGDQAKFILIHKDKLLRSGKVGLEQLLTLNGQSLFFTVAGIKKI